MLGTWETDVDVDAKDKQGWTPLYYAVRAGLSVAMVKLLIEVGKAHVRALDNEGSLYWRLRKGVGIQKFCGI